MASKWNLFWDPQKQAFPEEHAKNDVENGREPLTHKVDTMDRIFGGADEVRANEARYHKAYDEASHKKIAEENNEFLRQIAENTKR